MKDLRSPNGQFAAKPCAIAGLLFWHVLRSLAHDGPVTNDFVSVSNSIVRLQEEWRENGISEVVILHCPSARYYPVAVSQRALDAGPTFNLVISTPKEHEITLQLIAAIEKIAPQPSDRQPDLRWGFIFVRANRTRAFSIYLDGTGERGLVNETPVVFRDAKFLRWAESKLGSIFK